MENQFKKAERIDPLNLPSCLIDKIDSTGYTNIFFCPKGYKQIIFGIREGVMLFCPQAFASANICFQDHQIVNCPIGVLGYVSSDLKKILTEISDEVLDELEKCKI